MATREKLAREKFTTREKLAASVWFANSSFHQLPPEPQAPQPAPKMQAVEQFDVDERRWVEVWVPVTTPTEP